MLNRDEEAARADGYFVELEVSSGRRYSLHQPLSLALSHQPSQPLRHDQGEISGLNLLSFFVGSY